MNYQTREASAHLRKHVRRRENKAAKDAEKSKRPIFLCGYITSTSLRVRLADLAIRIVVARRHWGHSSSFLDMTPSLLIHLCKRADGRSVDGVAIHSEHRAVAGAIPARLKAVPVQVAANMVQLAEFRCKAPSSSR